MRFERRRPHTFRVPLSAGHSRRGQAPTHNRRLWRRLSLRRRSASCLRFLRGSPCVVLTVWAPCSSTGYSWTLCPTALLRNPAAPDCATRPLPDGCAPSACWNGSPHKPLTGLLHPFRDGITLKKRVLVAIATRTAGGLATRPGKGALDCSLRDGVTERKWVLVAVVTRTSSGLATRPGKRAPDCSSRDGVMWSTMIFVTIRHIGTFMPRDALYTQHARQTRPRHPQPAF